MNEKDKKKFKTDVAREIETLRSEIPRLEELLKPVEPDNAIGRISRMDNIVNQSVSETQLSKARTRLLRLEEALQRVDDDPDFGMCAECGEPIPTPRLQAMPESEFCVECAE